MSRNFDLMEQFRQHQSLRSAQTVESDMAPPSHVHALLPRFEKSDDEILLLVQKVFLRCNQEPPRMVVFVGIDHGDGCTRLAAQAAKTLAQHSAGDVCLVEANFRSPRLPSFLQTNNHHGLADALLEPGPVREFATPVDAEGKLWLLPSGALGHDSASLLASSRLSTRVAELRRDFSCLIVDAPPITRYSDALLLARLSDGVVVVLQAGSTRRDAAASAMNELRSSQIPLLGIVLNKRTFPIPERLYRML